MTRLRCPLPTLRSARYRTARKARFRPVVSLCREGVEPSGLPLKGFRVLLLPPFPDFAWRYVDRIEHFHQRTLGDLILQRSYAERALPPVRFRDVYLRREGNARYAPRWMRASKSTSLASRSCAYSCHVTPSTPGAAFRLSQK